MVISNHYKQVPGSTHSGQEAEGGGAAQRQGRFRRDIQSAGGADARTNADLEVANAYAQLLAEGGSYFSVRAPDVHVPAESTLGRWRSQLEDAAKAPAFLEWAKKNHFNPRYFILVPARGEIVGDVGGRLTTFKLSDDSGWSDVSRTLLSVANVFAPEPGQELQYTSFGKNTLPINLVAQFYGEVVTPTPAQVNTRLEQFKATPGFKLPDNYRAARSDEALSAQQQALGDEANRHALCTALKAQVDDANGRIDLEKVILPIDPRSALFASEQRSQLSVADYLRREGYKVPVNSQQAVELALALSFDLAHRSPGVETGGVKPLDGLLGASSLRKMGKLVEEWSAQQVDVKTPSLVAGSPGTSLLSRLVSLLPEATRNSMAENPTLAMDQLIRLPKAQALGKHLQEKLKLVETPTSAIECVSAALVHELDPNATKSAFNLAGFNLYSVDNAGASSAEIVKRFTTYLEGKVGAGMAPVAARLLLSAAAPEFLVKDMPPNLVFGSHTWANFAIEVSRIEQQVPGASANMTFSQVMAFGEAPPISLEGEEQLSVASHNALVAWGIANGVISSKPDHDYTSAQVVAAQEALNKQQKELLWARSVLSTPATTRRELALAELKRVFPNVDPTLAILQSPWVKHDSLSLLDIYMTGPIEPDKWESMDEGKFPYAALKQRFSELEPDINKVFAKKFEEYEKVQQSAWAILFKYQLSLLPLADRERIRQSDVSFYTVSRPYLKTGPCTSGLFTEKECLPAEPSQQEQDALKGRRGVLMKVVGSAGEVSVYSYFPFEGRIVKEDGFPNSKIELDDRPYFGKDTEGYIPGLPHTYELLGTINNEREEAGQSGRPISAYTSEKSGALAVTVSEFFAGDFSAERSEATGVTEIEKGRAYDEKLKGFFLSLIPLYDGVNDAIDGNVGGAVFNIGFDLLGFIVPGISAARGASKAGKPLLNMIKTGFFAGIGASTGFTESVHITKNLNKGARTGYRNINHLADKGQALLSRLVGNYGTYDVNKVYREGDIVKGFFRSAEDNLIRPVVAVFKQGGWYAYNVITKTPFGVQAAQFGILS